ncbi:hypothetical protein ACWKSP_35320 [Micromonosporaceae bacterium Da 78-11]
MERNDDKAGTPADKIPDLDQTADAADPRLSAADRRKLMGSAGGGAYGRDDNDQQSPPEPTT